MMIKLLLIAGLLVVGIVAYRSPLNARNSALRRITGGAILAGGAVGVLRPDLVTRLAQSLGVGRGADLVLYALVVISLFVWLSLYRRIHDLEAKISQLNREVALASARAQRDLPFSESEEQVTTS